MKEKGGRLFFGQHFQYPFEIADGAAGDRLRVGAEIEDFYGDVPFVVIFEQCPQNGFKLRISKARSRSIGIIHMNMAEVSGVQRLEKGFCQ